MQTKLDCLEGFLNHIVSHLLAGKLESNEDFPADIPRIPTRWAIFGTCVMRVEKVGGMWCFLIRWFPDVHWQRVWMVLDTYDDSVALCRILKSPVDDNKENQLQ